MSEEAREQKEREEREAASHAQKEQGRIEKESDLSVTGYNYFSAGKYLTHELTVLQTRRNQLDRRAPEVVDEETTSGRVAERLEQVQERIVSIYSTKATNDLTKVALVFAVVEVFLHVVEIAHKCGAAPS